MRILIADDHPLYLESVRVRLERLFPDAAIVEASGLEELLDRDGDRADLILLDLRMPGMDGVKGIARACEAYPGTPVVLMSGEAGSDDVRSAIQNGARGFLLKTMPAAAFSSAISLLVAGGTYLPLEALKDMPSIEVGDVNAGPSRRELDDMMTPKERQVLIGLVTGATNKELGRQLNLAEVTVKLHVRQILKKIGARNRAGAAAIAARAGLI